MSIVQGLLLEDDFLLAEIFSTHMPWNRWNVSGQSRVLLDIIYAKDSDKMKDFLTEVRKNIE